MLTYFMGMPELPTPLSTGSFRLKFTNDMLGDGIAETMQTGLLGYDATAHEVLLELELLSNIGRVHVERHDSFLYEGPRVNAAPGARSVKSTFSIYFNFCIFVLLSVLKKALIHKFT